MAISSLQLFALMHRGIGRIIRKVGEQLSSRCKSNILQVPELHLAPIGYSSQIAQDQGFCGCAELLHEVGSFQRQPAPRSCGRLQDALPSPELVLAGGATQAAHVCCQRFVVLEHLHHTFAMSLTCVLPRKLIYVARVGNIWQASFNNGHNLEG